MVKIHKENIWDIYEKDKGIICIPVNGFVKNNGCAVMGRGVAKECLNKFPGIDKILGDHIKRFGNVVWIDKSKLIAFFPTKWHWQDNSDISLIRTSAWQLHLICLLSKHKLIFYLPKPGCGNGKLNWEDVEQIFENLSDRIIIVDK